MANPYVQVGLTHVRRQRSIGTWFTYLAALLMLVAAYQERLSNRSPDTFFYMLLVFLVVNAFLALSLHIRQQFSDSRARLTPGFCRVHATVAAVVIVFVTVVLPGAAVWLLDLRSVGLVAVAVCLFSAVFWLALLASMWLSVTIGLLLAAMGCGVLFSKPVIAVMIGLASGDHEPSAIALLIVGATTVAFGLRRLTQLNEDMPFYRGWVVGCQERCRAASEAPVVAEPPGRRRGERREEQRVARLVEHVRRASDSRWSGVCRWQVTMPTGWSMWLVWAGAAVVMLLVYTAIRRPDKGSSQFGILGVLALLPIAALAGQFILHADKAARALLLPVGRATFLRQVGIAAALSQFQCWSAVCVVMLLWQQFVVRESVSIDAITATVTVGTGLQFWLFATVAWVTRHRGLVVVVGALLAGSTAALMSFATGGFGAFGSAFASVEWQRVVWSAAGLLALTGLPLIWATYRHWLQADVD